MPSIPDGYAVIPGKGRAVAQAITKLVEKTKDVDHGDITFSPIMGFIVPEKIADKYKAPKDAEEYPIQDNSRASDTETLPPAESPVLDADEASEKPSAAKSK